MSRSRLAWALAAVTVLLVALMLFLSAGREEAFDTIIYGLLALAFSGAGAVIISTSSSNAIGWIFLSAVIRETLQPTHVSLWVRAPEARR